MTRIAKITEKPTVPDTNLAVIGLYIYDKSVWGMIDSLKPSSRFETEITDVNNFFIEHGALKYEIIDSSWSDAGTIDSLFEASNIIKKRDETRKKI
jgi:glucose-1-phosphate thymidylyltransferase